MPQDQTAQRDDQRNSQDSQQHLEEQYRNQSFGSQFGSLGDLMGQASQYPVGTDAQQWRDAYFDLAEQTIRTTRRVTDTLALTQVKHQIVQEVKAAVISELSRGKSIQVP